MSTYMRLIIEPPTQRATVFDDILRKPAAAQVGSQETLA